MTATVNVLVRNASRELVLATTSAAPNLNAVVVTKSVTTAPFGDNEAA